MHSIGDTNILGIPQNAHNQGLECFTEWMMRSTMSEEASSLGL